jgi:hypothetical protein
MKSFKEFIPKTEPDRRKSNTGDAAADDRKLKHHLDKVKKLMSSEKPSKTLLKYHQDTATKYHTRKVNRERALRKLDI